MGARAWRRLADRRGMTRIAVTLLVLVVVAVGIISVPLVKKFLLEEARLECETAVKTARREMTTDFLMSLSSTSSYSAKNARDSITLYGRDNICPSGGTVYFYKKNNATSDDPYEIVCGLHGEDTKLCTQLNAEYVFSQIESAVFDKQQQGTFYPESINVELNGKSFTAVLVDTPVPLRSGTDSSNEYEGYVAFYSIAGHGGSGSSSGLNNGEICYFCFADENHCASWDAKTGWSGDSYK